MCTSSRAGNSITPKCGIKKIYQKNELIFTEGKITKEICFVTKGCARLFYNVGGKDVFMQNELVELSL